MEGVLAVYHRHYEDNEVLVCVDETSKQQVKETRLPRPSRPGAPLAYDCECERNWVSNLFMLFAPLEALRQAQEAANGVDGPAHESRLGAGGQETGGRSLPRCAGGPPGTGQSQYPSQGVLVPDLSGGGGAAHSAAAGVPLHPQAWKLAESCPELAEGMAEIEFSVFARGCLKKRLPDEESLCAEIHVLEQERNQAQARINWRFGILDARTKLNRLYPIHS